MRYAKVRSMDVVNGYGVMCSLFTQGCTHHCPHCFNEETWDFNGGKQWTNELENKFIKLCQNPHIDGISILGGEPLDQAEDIYKILFRVKKSTNKPIYMWSGYTFEQIKSDEIKWKVIKNCVDILIDGEFHEAEKDIHLQLRGSSNQRVIDIQKTIEDNKVVLWNTCTN